MSMITRFKSLLVVAFILIGLSLLTIFVASQTAQSQDKKETVFMIKLGKETTQARKLVFHNVVYQPINDPERLKKMAAVADQATIYPFARKLCAKIADCVIQYPPAGGKNLARAAQKAQRLGGYQYVLDFSRFKVIVPYNGLFKVMDRIMQFAGDDIVWINDRIAHPSYGYRDIQLYLRDKKSGLIFEVLILSPEISLAQKVKGHKLYEEGRAIHAKAVAEKRALTVAEKSEIKAYKKRTTILYDRAHLKSLSHFSAIQLG